MSEIQRLKGNQLSVGQRVAWVVYSKDNAGNLVKNDLNKNVIDKYEASTVKEIDREYVHLENGKKRRVTGNFIRLKSNTTKTYYDKNERYLLRDLEKATTVNKLDDDLETTPSFDEEEYLNKYTNEIKITLETFDVLSKKLENDEEQVNSKIYSVAKILSAAKKEATQQKDEKLEKKLFSKLKKEVSEKFKAISTRNLNKAIKVASDSRIQKYQSRLPVAHTVLYSLTSLSDDEFDKLMKDKDVTPDKTREYLLGKVRKIKDKKPQPQKYTITRISETKASDKDIQELKKLLKSKGWGIKEPRTNTKNSTT
jgi:hypothetical protein